ncbi:hypothetical protein Avbf_00870 [Armadillidium vulgare]|nr:hypothetical protein Avbf_00870 [Armadillidium vulgare]
MVIKSFTFLLCVFLCTCDIKFCIGEDEVPLLQLKQGLVKGIKEKSLGEKEFYSYLGIPFAKHPEGELRFKNNEKRKDNKNERSKAKSPKQETFSDGFHSWRSFYIWISNEYQPYILMNEDIVLVVIQYRVGIFGK